MIGNETFVQVFGSVPAGDDEALVQVVSNAIREGFAIVLLKPGEKTPACTLLARDRKAADTAAQTAARESGNPRWERVRHDCGKTHALTVQWAGGREKVRAKTGALIKRVIREYGGRSPNIAVHLGLSHRIVVDVDTDAERIAFARDWPADAPPIPGITVESPGKLLDGERWVHKDGGHFWFTLPEGMSAPAEGRSYRAPSGWSAYWGETYILVPPSVRAEGPYKLVGTESTAPAFLMAQVEAGARARADRMAHDGPLPDGSAGIDVWASGVSWADLLTPDGWTDTGKPDGCSCPIWTAPGDHASPKSATAHDAGCAVASTGGGHGPLHVWTSSLPEWMAEAMRENGWSRWTKPWYLAYRDHDGSIPALCRELGIGPGDDTEFPGFTRPVAPDLFEPAGLGGTGGKSASDQEEQERDGREIPAGPGTEPEPAGQAELTQAQILRSRMLGSAALDTLPEPEPLIEGFLDADTIARMTGRSGHGKSFVTLDMAGCVAIGQRWHGREVKKGLVVYMIAEGVRGWKARMRAWEARWHGGLPIPDSGMLMIPFAIQSTSAGQWSTLVDVLAELVPVFVVVDTQARVTVGVDENNAQDMGIFVERLEMIRRATGACVMAIHHIGHNGEHGRGSTAVLGALGSEIRVDKTAKGHLTVHTEKQKDSEEHEPLKFVLDPEGDSVVPVPDGWSSADPFTAVVEEAGIGVTSESPARDRMAAIIWEVFSHGEGCTPGEARALMVEPGHPQYGHTSKTRRYVAWSDLVRDKVLLQVVTEDGKRVRRFKLAPEEAHRLGLNDPVIVTESEKKSPARSTGLAGIPASPANPVDHDLRSTGT